jgi:hypothetical protein
MRTWQSDLRRFATSKHVPGRVALADSRTPKLSVGLPPRALHVDLVSRQRKPVTAAKRTKVNRRWRLPHQRRHPVRTTHRQYIDINTTVQACKL